MPMTQADFQEIADAVAEAKRVAEYEMTSEFQRGQLYALERVTKELATACARRYKGGYGFKRQKFVDACGFPEA